MEDVYKLDPAVGDRIRRLLPKENSSLSASVAPLHGADGATRLVATRFSFDHGEIVELTYWSKTNEDAALSVTRFMIEGDHGLQQCKLKGYTGGSRSETVPFFGGGKLNLVYQPLQEGSAPGLVGHTLNYLENTRIINRGVEPRR